MRIVANAVSFSRDRYLIQCLLIPVASRAHVLRVNRE